MENGQFKVVYNSDLIIRNRSELACLCVFYDKVLLPFLGDSAGVIPGVGDLNYEKVNIKKWELENGTLFDEGVLSRLPPLRGNENAGYEFRDCPTSSEITRVLVIYLRPEDIPDNVSVDTEDGPGGMSWITTLRHETPKWGEVLPTDRILERQTWKIGFRSYGPHNKGHFHRTVEKVKLIRTSTEIKTVVKKVAAISREQVSAILAMPVRSIRAGDNSYIAPDLAAHLTRTDIDLPQVFTTLKGQPIGRDILVALEAEAVFKYLLPKIHIYHPTQILELRQKIADTREGFIMHLWKLSKGLEERAKEGTSIQEISSFAKSLIETELIPDYKEFHRQLAATKAGRWEKVLDAAGKVVEIDAAPWTPKFYGLLLKALGLSIITTAAEQKEQFSNQYQAFKFMSDVEGSTKLP
jgi:hypothetical protein